MEGLGERAYTDPRVHAFFYLDPPPYSLDQALVGHLVEAARPKNVEVVADEYGAVHLPGAGAFLGCQPHEAYTLSWRGGWELSCRGATFCAPDFVRGSTIELDRFGDPGCARVLTDDDPSQELGGVAVLERHRSVLVRSLQRMFEMDDGYREELHRDCRLIRVYRSPTLYSCASQSAYGAAFLQCEDDASEVFFVGDLAHQIGHVTFYGVSEDRRRCFAIPPLTPLSTITANKADTRSLFDGLHGNFTIARMAGVYDAMYRGLDDSHSVGYCGELVGRFADVMCRFRRGLESVNNPRFFTSEVWEIHCALKRLYESLWETYQGVLAGASLRGQGYVFSWSIYREVNGLHHEG